MNAGLDAEPAQLCVVALSRICSLVPFVWQNKNIHYLQSQILQNKTSESKKIGERATFLTLVRRPFNFDFLKNKFIFHKIS